MTQYYMNGLNKLNKYTMQLILLFLLDYTLVFLSSLMICNSTTDENFASYSVYFLFMKNGFKLCNKMALFQITQKQFSAKCLLQRKLFHLEQSHLVQKLRVFDRKYMERDSRSLFHPGLNIPRQT